jgi:hypothetical protein
MKKMNLLPVAVLWLATVAFAGVDFSGSWVLDPANSDQMRMGPGGGSGAPTEITMTITMSSTEMTVSRTTARGTRETKYVLDGKENTSSTERGELKYKAVWEGDSLTISGTRTTQRGERPINEVYSLSADGKVLTIVSTRTGQQGETTRKQVFDKK